MQDITNEQFAALWNDSSTTDEARSKIEAATGRLIHKALVIARAVSLRKQGVQLKKITKGQLLPRPETTITVGELARVLSAVPNQEAPVRFAADSDGVGFVGHLIRGIQVKETEILLCDWDTSGDGSLRVEESRRSDNDE